ncbi:MAG: hypothetical protein ACM3UO_00305 [Bacillota bacterium]
MYGEKVHVGDRVEVAPHLDRWMRGDRFGVVEHINRRGAVFVKMDRSGDLSQFAPSNLRRVVQ